jgi:hypothetical protein
MTTGNTATILSVGKPLPQSLIGQQVTIDRYVAPSCPVVKLADGREYIMDVSRLDISSEKPELCGWRGKQYFSRSELVNLPGMPEKIAELYQLAQQQCWRNMPYAGEPQYYFGDFPDETKAHFLFNWFRNCERGESGKMLSQEQILEMTCSECGLPHCNRFTQSDDGKICFRCNAQPTAVAPNRNWLEAKMRHFERMIPKLAQNVNYRQLVRSMQAEYEQVLAMLEIDDSEVEF